jgi:hypothetical protein
MTQGPTSSRRSYITLRRLGFGVGRWLAIVAFGMGALGVLAHLVVHYHAVRAGSFSSHVDRRKLDVGLRFGIGYGAWRELMHSEHPELRSWGAHQDDEPR